MKKIIRVLTLTLAFAVLCGSFATTAYAKILYQCHCCGGDGIYTCDAVDCKDGKLPCGRCNSTGQTIEMCGDCNGTGKCRLCQGTGKRPGDDTIDCDNCNGTGQCQGGPGWGPCTQGQYYNQCPDCTGERVVWHNNEWCIYARNHDGQCPSCKGTGYEGEGGEGTPNDGVSNVPRAGDAIYYLNGSYAIYGGGYSGGENGSNGNETTSTPSENTTQPPATTDPGSSEPASYHNVSFGTGSWKIGDVTVTADKTGTQKISTIEIITLTNFDPDTMEVRVGAEDGFGLILKVTNGKTSISANDNDGGIPDDLTFMVFEKEAVPGGNEGDDENNNNGDNPNQAGKYIVWFGEGSWKIGDVTVTADKTNGQYLTETDIITLTNFDPDTMEVRVEAENGFRTTLFVNNGKTSISAHSQTIDSVPKDIAFSVVAKEASPGGNEDGENNNGDPDNGEEPIVIPPDRNQDFEIPPAESGGAEKTASAAVEVGKMTSEEQEHYAGLTDEELNGKLVNVQSILQTVRPGEFAADTEELINDVAELNGIDTLEEAKIFPLSFEGHEDLGFPIAVTVRLEKGVLKGDSDLFVYHILEDRSIESLGKAEYTTYDDGSVESITFYTTGFSSFFTSSKELNIDIPAAFPWPLLAAVLVGVIVVLLVVTIVLRRKHKKV